MNKEFEYDFKEWYKLSKLESLFPLTNVHTYPLFATMGIYARFLSKFNIVILATERGYNIVHSVHTTKKDISLNIKFIHNESMINYKLGLDWVMNNYPKSITPF